MKPCTKCREVKPSSDYAPCKLTKDKLHSWCKACKNEHTKQSRANNPEYAARRKAYMQTDARKAWRKSYLQSEHGKALHKAAKKRCVNQSEIVNNRKFYKLRASGHCPQWVKPKDVLAFYDLAYRAGDIWVVDHIIPLNGETVSGLHVPSNLQLLTKTRNQIKSNSFDGVGAVTGVLPP